MSTFARPSLAPGQGQSAAPAPGGPDGRDRSEGPAGPLRAVLTALEGGAATLDGVATATGLTRDVASAAVAHLVRLGRLSAEQLAFGCPGAGCGSCAFGSDGAPGCGPAGPPGKARGPVLVTLTVR